MYPRPDELATQSNIERDERLRGNLKKIPTLALGAGASYLGAKVAPFLSQYVPLDLAMKGIDKVAPQIGNFLRKGQKMGLDLEEGLNFVKDKLKPAESSETAKEHRNIIQKYSPELHEFISQKVKGGMRPGTIALSLLKGKGNEKFRNIIGKIVKDYSTDFVSLVESLYGSESMGAPQSQAALQPEQAQQPQQPMGAQQAPMPGKAKEKFVDMLTRYLEQGNANR